MLGHPGVDLSEVGFERADVQKFAGCVAESHGAVLVVGLELHYSVSLVMFPVLGKYIRMRTPSSSWVVTSNAWFEATLPARTNGLLCAATMVMLEYFRVQNSGQPLQGWVLTTGVCEAAALEAVALGAAVPPNTVRDSEEVVMMVPFPVAVAEALPYIDETITDDSPLPKVMVVLYVS